MAHFGTICAISNFSGTKWYISLTCCYRCSENSPEVQHYPYGWKWGGYESGVEPESGYQTEAGSIHLVCMLKCPWARYWTPNCSWCAGRHFAWQPSSSVFECVYELLLLWTKASDKCPNCKMTIEINKFADVRCLHNPAQRPVVCPEVTIVSVKSGWLGLYFYSLSPTPVR